MLFVLMGVQNLNARKLFPITSAGALFPHLASVIEHRHPD